jgi:hypothetical protein
LESENVLVENPSSSFDLNSFQQQSIEIDIESNDNSKNEKDEIIFNQVIEETNLNEEDQEKFELALAIQMSLHHD